MTFSCMSRIESLESLTYTSFSAYTGKVRMLRFPPLPFNLSSRTGYTTVVLFTRVRRSTAAAGACLALSSACLYLPKRLNFGTWLAALPGLTDSCEAGTLRTIDPVSADWLLMMTLTSD